MSDLEYWIWFSGLQHLRVRTRAALLEQFETAKGVWFADRQALLQIPGLHEDELTALSDKTAGDAARILRRCDEAGVQIITIQDAAFPERLRNIPDPPYVLYVKGKLPAIDAEPVIGIVGTRKSTPYGDKMARNIAYEIAGSGGIVATGLAGGVDSRAAEGALMAGGKVIGVLGVAINDVYPSYNVRLYEDVSNSGALISEYPPDAAGNRDWFPRRNRIIAALSLGVVVAEAPLRSGALITAHRALDYGRDVFAVPANADAVNSRGSNQLLREGALLTENGWDVLKEYEAQFPERIRKDGSGVIPEEYSIPEENRKQEQCSKAAKPGEIGKGFLKFRVPVRRKAEKAETEAVPVVLEEQLKGLNENQLKIVSVMDHASMHVDDIIDLSRLPAASVLSELTMLQIKGFVTQEQGKRFTLNIHK